MSGGPTAGGSAVPPRDSEGGAARWRRRALTLTAYALLLVVVLGSLPVLLPLALVVDLLRRSDYALSRVVLFFALYLSCEVLGVLAAFGVWLIYRLVPSVGDEAYLRWNFDLQRTWARILGGGAFRIFSIRVTVDGDEGLGDRPLLLFVRHASVADTVLAALFVSVRRGVWLRYVLKRELLWDPCLDIVGRRLPNCFVDRHTEGSREEVARVGRLAEGLGPGQGVLIYPEGTRFSERKRASIVERLAGKGDQAVVERARALRNVLPPRPGGTCALLRAAPQADVVVCAHRGFERTASFWELVNGGLIGAEVKVSFWTYPAASLPTDDAARVDWLFEVWTRLDAFVGGDDTV